MTDTTHEAAIAAMDLAFGIGKEQAHSLVNENAGARRIYDCALEAISSVLSSRSEVMSKANHEAKMLGASYVRVNTDGSLDNLDPSIIAFIVPQDAK